MYKDYILTFDAVDNGVSQYPASVTPKYRNPSDIFSWVNRLNPAWNSVSKDYDGSFKKAMNIVGNDFVEALEGIVSQWMPARTILHNAMQSSKSSDYSDYLIVMDISCPWKEHLFELEEVEGKQGKYLYIVFPDEVNSDWRIQAVPNQIDSFETRKGLPKSWRGLRDENLDLLLNLPGCVFVHAGGFIGGHKTKEGAIAMAKLAYQSTE